MAHGTCTKGLEVGRRDRDQQGLSMCRRQLFGQKRTSRQWPTWWLVLWAYHWGPHRAGGKRFLRRRQFCLRDDGFGGDHGRLADWRRRPGRFGVSWTWRDGVRRWTKGMDNIDRLEARLASTSLGGKRSPCCFVIMAGGGNVP